MESGVLDIIIGKGPSARTIQLELPPFTLIAATTRIALLSSPLRSRFSGGVFRLEFYNHDEIKKILARSAKILGVELEDEAQNEIASRARFTPRTANYFLKRCRDYAQVHKMPLSKNAVKSALSLLEIDEIGLTSSDRRVLEIIINKFNGGPVGLKTIAAALSEEEATVEEVIEPYLIQLGLLERTARGRVGHAQVVARRLRLSGEHARDARRDARQQQAHDEERGDGGNGRAAGCHGGH